MKLFKKIFLIIAAAAVIAAAAACVLFIASRHARQADLRHLQEEEYTAVFLTMVPYEDMASDAVGADFFMYYLGQKAAVASSCIRNADELNDYLGAALGSGNEVSLVCLELVPFQMDSFGGLNDLIAANPDTDFHILLDAPSMDYWLSQGTARAKKKLVSYGELAGGLLAHSNVELYFMGAEDWLIMNPANYMASLVTNREINQHLALLTWDSDRYRLTEENYTDVLASLEDKINLAKTAPQTADLSDWCFVFFGDSIIGNYTDSTSIPGAAAGIFGCEAYNLGIGGTRASGAESSGYVFPVIVDRFLQRDTVTLPEGVIFPQEMTAYYEREKERKGKRLCFVVNYGLNDYFCGAPIDNPDDPFDRSTYAGALRSGIRELQTAYPEAVIVLAAPTYTAYFSQGQDRMSDVGGIITDYVEAAGRAALDTNVIFMNNYYDLGVDSSNDGVYLEDGAHLAENGRFLYAQALIRLILRFS